MRALIPLLFMVAVGCGAVAGNSKKMLSHPVNKTEFESAVMGRTSKEVSDMFGPPRQTTDNAWVYDCEVDANGRKGPVLLFLRGNTVFRVQWPN